jgi:MoaA/NifB/PqqE/SkfB family radical SAM enzyme
MVLGRTAGRPRFLIMIDMSCTRATHGSFGADRNKAPRSSVCQRGPDEIPGLNPMFKARDFAVRPLLVIWEMTQAYDLKCMHCRASTQPNRHALELSTSEAFNLVDQVANMRVPMFVLTGGDPLKRPDLQAIVRYARHQSLKTSLTPSATPQLTREAVFELKKIGLMRMALSLDGSTPQLHDSFRCRYRKLHPS